MRHLYASVLILIAVISAVAVSGCTQSGQDSNTSGAQIANPASVFCVQNMSGTLSIVDTPEGQVGYCNLLDGRVCEEWTFFRNQTCAAPA